MSTRIVIAEHDDRDIDKLCHEAGACGLEIEWFKLGLDSTEYEVLWKSGEAPALRFQNVVLSPATLSAAPWVFHREYKLKKEPIVRSSVGSEAENAFCTREWTSLISSAILTFKFGGYAPRWVSSFWRADFTDRKLFLLSQAASLGVKVPSYVVASIFEVPADSRELVAKAINANEVIDDRYFPTTHLTDAQALEYTGQRTECPSLVQRKISATCELRIFYVGETWICLELVDQTASVDVRYSTKATVTMVDRLPRELKSQLANLCKLLEMNYCVFDVLVDAQGQCWLIDITPNGTWSWFESLDNIDVTKEILAALEGQNEANR